MADAFERAAVSDAGQACDLLARGTRDEVEKSAQQPCADALGEEDLPDPSRCSTVEVYGHDAIVRFGNDTVFLARFPDGLEGHGGRVPAGTDRREALRLRRVRRLT